MEERTPINEEELKKSIKQAYKKQLATCKDNVKFSRSQLRATLEQSDLILEIVKQLKEINITITRIGAPAISEYLSSMKQKLDIEQNQKGVEEKEENVI